MDVFYGSFGCAHPYNIDMHVWGTNGTVIATNTLSEAKVCLRSLDRNKWMDFPAGAEAKGLAAEFQVLANAIRNDAEIESDGVSGARTVAIGIAAAALAGFTVSPRRLGAGRRSCRGPGWGGRPSPARPTRPPPP